MSKGLVLADRAAQAPRVTAHDGPSEAAADHAAAEALLGRTPGTALGAGADGDAGVPARAALTASEVVSEGGAPLSGEDRAFFEPRFGQDLSGIRLHVDAATGAAAQGIGATAYAHGDNIGFAPGAYRPGSLMARPRLGHEIAHSLQQRGQGKAPVIQRQRPVNPEIANLPANRYVDAYAEVAYDLDYRAVDGNLSTWLTVTYSDGAQIDINIHDIADRNVNLVEAMANGRVGEQGRVFPSEMTRTTVPRLWAAGREAIAVMEEYNFQFMQAALPAVIFIIFMAGAPPTMSSGSGSVRRITRPRPTLRTSAASGTGRTAAGSTTAAAGSTAAGGAASGGGGFSFRIVSDTVRRYAGRDIVVIETSAGRQAFYRRTGLGGANAGGAQPGQWAPFDGILVGWFDKARYVTGAADDVLYRFGTAENRAASQWLGRQGIGVGDDVGQAWGVINEFLESLGALRMGGG